MPVLPAPRPGRRWEARCARMASCSVDALLADLLMAAPFRLNWSGKGLTQIPATGSLVILANHPLGWWDEVLLLQKILPLRPDLRLLGEPTQRPAAFRPYYLPIAEAAWHLAQGGALGMFPAGESQPWLGQERPWRGACIRLLQAAGAPVLPVCIRAQGLGRGLRPATVKAQAGSLILPQVWGGLKDPHRLGRYLRARLFALGSELPVQPFFRLRPARAPRPEPLAPAGDAAKIAAEVAALRPEARLCQQDRFVVYIARATE
ncbi:MAG: hypothetical protein D6722_22675, partial [Bacteroidetes bacterium]